MIFKRKNREPKPENTMGVTHQALEPTLLDDLEAKRRGLTIQLDELEVQFSKNKHELNRAIGKCEEEIAFLRMIYERHPTSDKTLRAIVQRLAPTKVFPTEETR
jgi:hypothetical protein